MLSKGKPNRILLPCSIFLFSLACRVQAATLGETASWVEKYVDPLKGNYREEITDLKLGDGCDSFRLNRYYTSGNESTDQLGGWVISPALFLTLGQKHHTEETMLVAYMAEHSGEIYAYEGPLNENGSTAQLKVDLSSSEYKTTQNDLTHCRAIQNYVLHYDGETCSLITADGTHRLYQAVERDILETPVGNFTYTYVRKVSNPRYFRLIQEFLPTGNNLLYSYDNENRLRSISLNDNSLVKTFYALFFEYEYSDADLIVRVTTTEENVFEYTFLPYRIDRRIVFALKDVKGNTAANENYDYCKNRQGFLLTKVQDSQGKTREIHYDFSGKVAAISKMAPFGKETEEGFFFFYGNHFTNIVDKEGNKIFYEFDSRRHLTEIKQFEKSNRFLGSKKFIWDTDVGFDQMTANILTNQYGQVYSHIAFKYDLGGNICERLEYTLPSDSWNSLLVDSEGTLMDACGADSAHTEYVYSIEGLNLLDHCSDSQGNQTYFTYKQGTNLLLEESYYVKGRLHKRIHYYYAQENDFTDIVHEEELPSYDIISYPLANKHEFELSSTLEWGLTPFSKLLETSLKSKIPLSEYQPVAISNEISSPSSQYTEQVMHIESSGLVECGESVFLPVYGDFAYVYDTSVQEVMTAGVYQDVMFNEAGVRSGWYHSDKSAEFICPSAGHYAITYRAQVCSSLEGETTQFSLQLAVNGESVPGSQLHLTDVLLQDSISKTIPLSNCVILNCEEGDQLTIQFTGSTTSAFLGHPENSSEVESTASLSIVRVS